MSPAVASNKLHEPAYRVLLVGTSYPADLSDWRGLFIRHLAFALARRPDLLLRIWVPPGELPSQAEYAATAKEARWLASLMASGGIAHLVRTHRVRGAIAGLNLLRSLRRLYRRERQIDLYHVNWLQNALVLPDNRIPLLTTVLGTDMQLLKLPGMTSMLRNVFRSRKTMICPNADWMVSPLQEQFGDVADVRFMPFGIEPRWFAIERKPQQPQQWICVSRLTQGKIGTLYSWGEKSFRDGKRELHLFGPMQQEMTIPEWVHYHGPATPESLSDVWFPRAQGLVTLSQHAEGRPQVILEAMASGLPVIASRLPAHEDILAAAKCGYLCASAAEFDQALDALETPERNQAMGDRARLWARNEIGTWDESARRYTHAYRELIQGTAR